MTVVIILIILFLVWLLFGERIRRWLARKAAERTEDFIRKSVGMPPRPGSKEARRQQQQHSRRDGRSSGTSQGTYGYYSSDSSSRRRRRAYSTTDEPIIPKEYAEDVEFVETINYSETFIGADNPDSSRTVYHESQVSDVEWEEIKTKKR